MYPIYMGCLGNKITNGQIGSLRYIERASKNNANAPTILFLHGNSFSSAVFQRQFESTQLESFRLVAIDMPGHGSSEPFADDADYTFGTLADAISEAIDELDLTEVVIAGWSLGGHVALDMLDRSPRLAGAMIFGAPPLQSGALSSIRAYHFSRDMFLASKAQFSEVDAMRFEKFCIGKSADGQHLDTIMRTAPNMRSAVFKSVLQGKNRDQYQLAVGAEKPLCILHGVDDPLVRASYVESIGENPGYSGEIAMIEGAGHAPFIDQAETFDFMLASFVRRVAKGEIVSKSARKKAA